jgi:hypothetical protein
MSVMRVKNHLGQHDGPAPVRSTPCLVHVLVAWARVWQADAAFRRLQNDACENFLYGFSRRPHGAARAADSARTPQLPLTLPLRRRLVPVHPRIIGRSGTTPHRGESHRRQQQQSSGFCYLWTTSCLEVRRGPSRRGHRNAAQRV